MKVVINNCFGGFSLSNRAMHRYYELKGIKLYEDRKYSGEWINYYSKPVSERSNEDDGFVSNFNIPRNDPHLVQVVEELRDAADGSHAALKVVDFPDGLPWQISEYDGSESVEFDMSEWENMLSLSLKDEGMKELLDKCVVYYQLKKMDDIDE